MQDGGFLLVNKPLNWTSFDVIAKIRKKFNIKKVGHTGTLDPLATGLMVIGLGTATRFLEFHVGHNKEYEAEVTFGAISETYDAEGPISPSEITKEPKLEDIQQCIDKSFLGEIEQIPPKYSALKINGEKYCNLVRQGKEVDIEAKKRRITIFENEIISYEWPKLKIRVKCSSGTYIRSIANDLGEALGCGGYLSGLHRTMVEDFEIKDAKVVESLTEQDLLPFESGLEFEKIELNEEAIQRLKFGQRINLEETPITNSEERDLFQIFLKNTFCGIAEIQKGVLKPKKMVI